MVCSWCDVQVAGLLAVDQKQKHQRRYLVKK